MFDKNYPLPINSFDSESLKEFFKKKRLVPQFGDYVSSNHYFCRVLMEVCANSQSFNSCMKDLKNWSFGKGGELVIKDSNDNILDKAATKALYKKMAKDGVSSYDIVNISRDLLEQLKQIGNAYLKVKRIIVGSTQRIHLDIIDPKNLVLTEDGEYFVYFQGNSANEYISDKDDKKKLYSKTALGQPLNWRNNETIIHIRENYKGFYGYPDILAVFNSLGAEYNYQVTNNINSQNEFTAKVILLIEDALNESSQSSNFANSVRALRKLTANTDDNGDNSGKIMAAYKYANGTKEPSSIRLDVNRDSLWFREAAEFNAANIYGAMGWSRELSGQTYLRSNLGKNFMTDLFITKNISTIQPIQELFERFWNDLLSELVPSLSNYTIAFPSLVDRAVDAMVEIEVRSSRKSNYYNQQQPQNNNGENNP